MTAGWIANGVVLATVAVAARAVFSRRMRQSEMWRATVTPLASIIGSGFLVLAPILMREFGHRAVWVMAALCAVSYAVGGAIRWNIRAIDRMGGERALHGVGRWIDDASSWMLALAYVVSVTYYLNLLGAFSVSLTPWNDPLTARIVTTVVLLGIATLGWFRGLRGLESAEATTVDIKLAVIAGLLAGLALFTWRMSGDLPPFSNGHSAFGWHSAMLAFGLLITVQGFETSRYLSAAYSADTRIRTMRRAQWLSAAIYITYIGLVSITFSADDIPHRETAIIDMMAPVASVLPVLLVLAALSAQFSAAVADTNGCGGLVTQMSRGRIGARMAYLLLAMFAVALTWSADIYQIISHASRAFAAYYALQCALAWWLARRASYGWLRSAPWLLLALLMLVAAGFGIPAE